MRSSACRTTSTDARAVSTAQNARVISSFRSARALAILPGASASAPAAARERPQATAVVDGPLQIDPRSNVVSMSG